MLGLRANFFDKKNLGPKKMLGPNSKKKLGFKFFKKENVSVRIFVLKNFGSAIFFKFKIEKNCWVEKNFGSEKKFGSEKMCTPQIFFGPKKFWIKKMLEKYFGSKKSPMKCDPKNLGPKSLVKIGLVTAEILLI